ncbi:MAG: ABC transporter ATP-binding protein/permease [Candidatus Omnitrophica bacterium]|nr:ABC transporter ATP-binding protein/permease [Candidatus Omnitrophota bacterium]
MIKLLVSLRLLFLPYRRPMLIILSVTLAASFLEGLSLAAFYPLLSTLLAASSQAAASHPAPMAFLLRVAERLPFQDPLLSAMALLFLVTLGKGVAVLTKDLLIARISGTVQHDLKQRLMRSYAASSFIYFLDRKRGDLLYQLSTAATRAGVLAQKIPQWFAEACKVAAIGALLLASAPWMTMALGVIGFSYHRFTQSLSQKISYHTGKERVETGAAQSSIASEFLDGIRQIMAFGTQGFWLKRFEAPSLRFRDLYIRDSMWLAIPRVLLELALIFLLLTGLALLRWARPDLLLTHLPLMGILILGLLKLLPSLTLQGQLRMEAAGLAGDALNLQEALENRQPGPEGSARPAGPLRKSIVFEGVGFSYPARPPLLRDLNLALVQGETTALVGPSGSGKTTLAHLLLKFVEPSSGRILADGIDLRHLSLEGWRRQIGFVSQEIFVFHGSVEENIRFGREGFTPEEVRQAARVAKAEEFIESLPEGYRTLVGEKGMKLSGGQQQRLAIARAVLHHPEILLLDEATSSLDTESESLIQEALERLCVGRTVILIAHRLSTVRRADRIVVLEQGRVVEEGRHDQLLLTQGRYAQWMALGQTAVSSVGGLG